MLNIFYQKETLNDTLIISLSNLNANKVVAQQNVTKGYLDDKLVFVNIKNYSKYDPSLKSGMIFLDDKLANKISEITNENVKQYFDNGFKVCQIIDCQKIEKTHLSLCKVDIGQEKPITLICGAQNARIGLKTIICLNNTYLPNGKFICSGKVLNYVSNGMLCSLKELNLATESHGIIELDDSYKIGDYYLKAYANV